MTIFIEVIFKGVYSEYTWLKKEYNTKYRNQKKYLELSPKQISRIIDKYYNDLHNDKTKKFFLKMLRKFKIF